MHNPYQPPEAAVADAADADEGERPAAVSRAVQLLWATMAIGFVLALIDVVKAFDENPDFAWSLGLMFGALAAFGVFFGITFWVYRAVHAGRNWARIVVLVFTIVWTLVMIVILVMLFRWAPELPAETKRELLINAVQFAMTLVATSLLFTPPANRWYRAIKAARA